MIRQGIFLISLIMVMGGTSLHAAANALNFLDRSMSPRAAGMGMSYVSLASGHDAVYWNPAGLMNSQKEFDITTSQAFEAQYISLGGVFSWGAFPIGVSYVQAGVDGFQVSLVDPDTGRAEDTGTELDYRGSAVMLSSAVDIMPAWTVGATLKLLQEDAGINDASGFGVDVGTLWHANNDFRFGLTMQNLVRPEMKWDTASGIREDVPQIILAGISMDFLDDQLTVSVDSYSKENRDTELNIGVRYFLMPIMPVRAGVRDGELSLGLGLDLGQMAFDFSWTTPDIDEFDDVYRFGVRFGFE